MALWSIEWTREASNYLDDNGPLVARLYLVIRDLVRTEGIPAIGGATQEAPGEYVFEPEGHIVFYRRIEEQKRIIVLAIKPQEDSSFLVFLM